MWKWTRLPFPEVRLSTPLARNPMKLILACLAVALFPSSALAQEDDVQLGLLKHEPIVIGFNKDQGSGVQFDFRVSFKLPLTSQPLFWNSRPFLGLSTRFSQYLTEVESKPVLGRRFNPELFFRYRLSEADEEGSYEYLDYGFGHESNGQSIDSQDEYLARRVSLVRDGDAAGFATKYVSRGWDYLGLTWKQHGPFGLDPGTRSYLRLRYFLRSGPLQGRAENFHPFEGAEDPGDRNRFDGVRLLLRRDVTLPFVDTFKCALRFETGYIKAFQNNTIGLELSSQDWKLPLTFWVRHGYNSDLASYFERSSSAGIGFEFLGS